MTVTVSAKPVPGLASDVALTSTLAAEQAFWRDLSCIVADTTFEPVAASNLRTRYLITAGVGLRTATSVSCSWLRLTVRGGSSWRPLGVFPQIVTETSGATGPVRTTPAGQVERDMVAGGDGLPAYMVGWSEPNRMLIWDVLPVTHKPPEAIMPLLILCEGNATGTLVVEYRVLARLRSPTLGWHLAAFDCAVTSREGTSVVENTEGLAGIIDPVTVGQGTDSAADLLLRMSREGHAFGVLVDGGDVVGVVSLQQLKATPGGAAAASVAVGPLPIVTAETTVHEIARLVRGASLVPPDLRGAVVLEQGAPVGFVREVRIKALIDGGLLRGEDPGNIPGVPVSRLIFECAAHGETLSVAYYDPSDPPRCSNGDLMSRRR
jgi:hypothetical protein